MSNSDDPLSVALFSEMFMADQLARNRLSRALPKGMELSHFSVLNHLARSSEEKSPAQLARVFHVTRGAMTNTLNRLEWAGHIHIRPDWDDARRKMVAISTSGLRAREAAIDAIAPILAETVREIGADRVRQALPVIRELRLRLEDDEGV
ncbi:Transcriptional regulator, MarR family [Roseibacterium elongatum DSM 19469]|uniref:Transcriptional regulator, MarR family n=1 Tax=Roseicyclus elongatus DSM 19469 TaxID=1294273 RepID=W8S3M6_9RHOB|nr:MarR family transcriptional regulator [Roseibacterium elongatum]AHM03361.1 Transcriptional regulator, MarR family [Roseibacterium elongatum DSM 19469]